MNDAWVHLAEGVEKLSRFLSRHQLTPLHKRIGVLAFGANRNPDNIAWKLNRYGNHHDVTKHGAIIVLPAKVRNADIVAANLFYSGHFYGDLLLYHPMSQGTTVEACVQLIDLQQLHAIHRSEDVPEPGRMEADFWGCGLSEIGNIDLVSPHVESITVLGYVSSTSIFVSPILGQPVAFENVSATGRSITSLAQRQMFHHLMEMDGLRDLDESETLYKLQMYWRRIKAGLDHDIEMKRLHDRLCMLIKQNGLRDMTGNLWTGINAARTYGTLLNPKETWDIPMKYYYPIF